MGSFLSRNSKDYRVSMPGMGTYHCTALEAVMARAGICSDPVFFSEVTEVPGPRSPVLERGMPTFSVDTDQPCKGPVINSFSGEGAMS